MPNEGVNEGVRGSGRVVWLGLCLVTFVVASFVLVGSVASREKGFDWELSSIFGKAVGTTLLALSTGWLAYSTRSEVRATQDLAELTRESQAASERPLVLFERVAFQETEPNRGFLILALVNAGLGPALRIRLRAVYRAGRLAPQYHSRARFLYRAKWR